MRTLLLLAFIASACASPAPDGASTGAASTSIRAAEATLPPPVLAGVAGIIPPHWPTPRDADWRTFFAALDELGNAGGNYTGWDADTGLAELDRNRTAIETAGVEVLDITGFHRDAGSGLTLTVDFADPAQVAAFTDDLAAYATERTPRFLGAGNEVNRVWEHDPAAFDAWVAALPGIVDAVHAASPRTQVLVTFQYEFLRGGGAITGVAREPQWELLDRVAPHVDLVAFTTYPFFDYATPAEIPRDYYAEAQEHAGGRIGLSEIGWPSAPIAPLEGSALAGLGGTPEEQAAFIARLRDLLAPLDLEFAMWSWAYDTDAVGPPFDSIGLAANDGTPKPAWAAWRAFAGRLTR